MALSPAEQQIADDLLAHQLDLFRLDASLRNDALSVLDKLARELKTKLAAGNLTTYSKAQTDSLLREIQNTISDYYRDIQKAQDEALAELPQVQSNAVRAALVAVGYEAALPPPTHFAVAMTEVMIQGAPSAEWWAKQSRDTAFRFMGAVRQGIVQGKPNQQIISEVIGKLSAPGTGVLEVSRRNAAALVQTSVATVANAAREQSFLQNADVVKGMHQLSTLDSHTSDICIAYSGGEWDLKGKPINGTKLPYNGGAPRHWNCRSLMTPITRSFKELGLDIPEIHGTTRASMDGQVPTNTTFDAFLKRKGQVFQDEILGKGRAELWRDKKITLQQLLDLRGNPLSLAELKAKYSN